MLKQASEKAGSRHDSPWPGKVRRMWLISSPTLSTVGDGVVQGKRTCYYQTNGEWVPNRQKQDQAPADGGSNPLVLQKLRKDKRLPVVTQKQTRASWLQIWWGFQSTQFGIHPFSLKKPPGTSLILIILEVFTSLWPFYNSFWFWALEHMHEKAFLNFFRCNS